MSDISGTGSPYETKTIRMHEPDRGQYLYCMITRFDGRDHILGDLGYGGVYYHFAMMSMNTAADVASPDLYRMAQDHPTDLTETNMFELLYALDNGEIEWSDLEDGEHLDPLDLKGLTATEDGEEEAQA